MTKPNILIIDDDPVGSAVLLGYLHQSGHEDVEQIQTGPEALVHMVGNIPDLIFLDIMMPDLDGWLMCEIFSKVSRWKKIPIVLQSGLIGADNIKKGLSLGAHSYIEKPITLSKIQDVLEAVLTTEVRYPTDPPDNIQKVLRTTADAAKTTLNLMMGAQTRVAQVAHFDPSQHLGDFAYSGIIGAYGGAAIEVSLGWTGDQATDFAVAMMGLEPEDMEEELLQDTMNEVLNMVLGSTTRNLNAIYPVQLGLPDTKQGGEIPINDSDHRFYISLKTQAHEFPMLLTVKETPERVEP